MSIDKNNSIDTGSEFINPTVISQIASRLFNEFPEARAVPKNEGDAANVPTSFQHELDGKAAVFGQHIPTSPEKGSDQDTPFAETATNTGTNGLAGNYGKEALLRQEWPNQPLIPDYQKGNEIPNHPDFYFLSEDQKQKQSPLGNHADNLVDQQTYAGNKDGSYGLQNFINRSQPAKPNHEEELAGHSKENFVPFFNHLGSGLPADDVIDFTFLFANAQTHLKPDAGNPHANPEKYLADTGLGSQAFEQFPLQRTAVPETRQTQPGGKCIAQQIYEDVSAKPDGINLDSILQSYKNLTTPSAHGLDGDLSNGYALPTGHLPTDFLFDVNHLSGLQGLDQGTFFSEAKNSIPENPHHSYYFLNEPVSSITQPGIFDVATIRRDFPVLGQKVHGKPLIWFDNAATTQKPRSVIDAVATFYATDNSNIHRGAHTLAARATDAYEQARDKIRQFIGAGSSSEIIFVRGTTEGVNLVAQTWGRKFIQPGDEIVLTILEHHANIVPWQMLAKEKGAIIRVAPVNDNGEILLDEYAKLLGPRTKFVSLTQASNGLGTVVPVKEMVQMAKRYNARVMVDGAQSVAHIPANVQDLDADFFVFSGHKIFSPNGIGAVYAKSELQEIMPPWQGGGNMIKDVTFEETTYNEPPAKFEAGTPNVGGAIGLGAALDYVNAIGIENIARYEHSITVYGMEQLGHIPDLRLIGTAKNKVGILSFVLKNLPNEEVGKLLDKEGIAVRAGHHCTQPSLRRFGVESTVRPSLAFYNTKEEIDQLVYAIKKIQRR
jgi:cysteine desulfurase / selenocysteine lyase